MLDDPVLLNDWHVVARAAEIKPGDVVPVRLLGRHLVIWRNADGFHAWFDRDRTPVRRGGLLGSFGRNAIAGYTLHEMASIILASDALQIGFRIARPMTGTRVAALVPVAIFVGLVWWPIAALDRRGWHLKI